MDNKAYLNIQPGGISLITYAMFWPNLRSHYDTFCTDSIAVVTCPVYNVDGKSGCIAGCFVQRVGAAGYEIGGKIKLADTLNAFFGVFNRVVNQREMIARITGIESKVIDENIHFTAVRVITKVGVSIGNTKLNKRCIYVYYK